MLNQPRLIASLSPYIPGKPIETVAREYGLDPKKIAKLASNENPLGPPKAVQDALHENIANIHIYPDGGAYNLRTKMAAKFQVDPDWIIFGNGSVEIIEMSARAFLDVGDQTLYSKYAFAMYKIATLASNHEGVEIEADDRFGHDLDAFLAAIDEKTKIIYIANPNNPTSTLLDQAAMDRFIEQVPDDILVIIDEAYFEFVENPDYADSMKYLREGRKNVMVLRTFSKIYGLAGLRVGYGFGHPETLAMLEKVRSPFNLNLLAQVACEVALDCDDHVRKSRELVQRERAFVKEGLDKMGLRYIGDEGNFIIVDMETDICPIFEAMQQKGVIVRPLMGYGMPTWLRMSYGIHEENARFLKVLDEVR